MDLLISFIIFIFSVMTCLLLKASLCYALLIGLFCFFMTGLHRGFRAKDLFKMIRTGGKTSFVVFKILFFIGCLTALWRASGTISFFVYYGIKIIIPHIFIVISFLLPLVLSFALGTSFGVTGTAGVVLMSLARSGGVNEIITAGAIMSGAYFGDRCSPASSAAVLTASVSGADHQHFLKMMLKTSIIPLIVTLAIFGALSIMNPINSVNDEALSALESTFNLSCIAVMPAAILVIMPWLKVSITKTIIASGATAFVMAVVLQGQTIFGALTACIIGYTVQTEILRDILSGGGVISMVEVMIIILLSSTYSGIFNGTGMLIPVQKKVGSMADKLGLFTTQIILAVLSAGVFCNQTVGTVLAAQMLGKVYEEKGATKEELATDIGNSIIVIAGLIPWSIAATVPLAMLDVGSKALLFSVFLYAVPLCYLFSKQIWYKSTPRK